MSTATLPLNAEQSSAAVESAGPMARAYMWLLVYAVVFINASDFRGDTGEEFSVHWQIYLRLLICGVCGATGILFLHRAVRPLTSFPGFLATLLIVWIGLTMPFSINRSYSMAAYVSMGAVVMMIPAAMQILGGLRFLLAIAAGLLTFQIGSWIAYLAFPDIGIFNEQVSQTEVVARMGGLAHPNELGFYSAYTIVLFASLAYGRHIRWLFAGPVIALAFATLAVCFSRTAIAVSFVGLLVVYRRELFTRRTILWALTLAIIVTPLAFAVVGTGELDWLIGDAMEKVSKSGTTDELTTATGRTEIWAEAIDKISEQPLYGYGYVTARFVMEDFSYHCHNILLNMCMHTGLVGGIILLTMILYFVYVIYHDPRFEIDGLIAVILTGGLIDGTLISAVPSASMTIWFSALMWRQMKMKLS